MGSVGGVVERFRVVPASYVVLRRGDEVLLHLRQNTGYRDGFWANTAGHIEVGESAFTAAVRETREEFGIEIHESDLTPLCAMHRTQSDHDPIDERVDFFFECWRWSGTPRIVEPAKNAELRWCALDALPDPVVPHELRLLRLLRAGALPPILADGF